MTAAGVVLGLSIGLMVGAGGVLILNVYWSRFAEKQNQRWSEFCRAQNERWYALSLDLIQAPGRTPSSLETDHG